MELGLVMFLLGSALPGLGSALPGLGSGYTTDYYMSTETAAETAAGPKGSCGGHLTTWGGEFASPEYPNNYPDYADCTWSIQSPDHKFIVLRFRYVNIEMSSGCRFDAVRVYDGPSNASPLLGSLCGSQIGSFRSRGNKLTVVFTSDNYGTGGGFVAHWTLSDFAAETTLDTTTAETSLDTTTAMTSPIITDYVTCKDRCGYDGGICSCTSSCQSGGHCCPDYNYYCSPPTPDYSTTTEMPLETPTVDHSCLHNCGYNFGWCSCSSSCQYYGNCCPDYYDHCFTTTATTVETSVTTDDWLTHVETSVTTDDWLTHDYGSCRDRCGQSGALCSCSSSCQYFGGCCHDYNYYCSSTTTDFTTTDLSGPPGACGGSRYGSGSISSPYYPNYYHDNAYCVWQLSATAGQTIFLSFQDFDLERCCNCDYVNVYDGPSTASRLIGKLCHNDTNHLDFQSSSSYMTVLFRSDFSGVGRGFKAHFSSSLNKNTARVDCSSDWMNIAIRKSYLDSLGFSWHDLYLDDHRCRPSADNYYVTFNFPIHSCSTRRKTDNGRIIYSNNVRSAQSTSGEITRHASKFLMLVNCVMERDSSVGTIYEAKEITNATIGGTGHFNTTMAFYPSSSFSYPITESPYRVNLDQQLYVQVQLSRAEPSLHLFVDSCVASPDHDFSSRTYVLISNGCRRDGTVDLYRNGNRYFAQFSFRAFKFLRTHDQVFLRCDVVICADNDYNSRCRQGCRNRRRRSLSSDHHTEVVTLGPITLKGPEEAAAKKEDEE